MRKLILLVWLLVPVAAGAYHYGPGQEHLAADRAAEAIARAEEAVTDAAAIAKDRGDEAARPRWSAAVEAYGEALDLLPEGRVAEARRLRLERAKAQLNCSQLPEARRDLGVLLDELLEDDGADAALVADARGTLATAQYYRTWLMRLEGVPREEWEREIEASRQNYKLLAEAAEESGDEARAETAREDLESAIRLARMDLDELQGLPLPSQ